MTDFLDVDLDASGFISQHDRGELPREFIVLAAKGFLPLPQDELVTILAFLSATEDREVADTATETLRELPVRVVQNFALNQSADPRTLDNLGRAITDPAILEPILRNRSTSDDTVLHIAAFANPQLQEVIVINHERLLRQPEILEALSRNPKLSGDARRRVNEIREEYFQKKRIEDVRITTEEERQAEADEYALTEEEKAEFADLLQAAEEAEEERASLETPFDEADAEQMSIWTRIQHMTVSQRVQCALKGGRTERSILIKDRNKLVCSAVVRSPRITESEVETFAGLRNIEEEALRIIGTKRDWMQKYPLALALVKNPKAPIGVVLPLINRLNLRDLKTLSSDKGVSDAVRQSARRLYNARKQS